MQSLVRSFFIWIAGAVRHAGNLIRSFATWWLGELGALVPNGVREFLAGEEHTLRIQVRGNLVHIGGGAASEESWELSLDGDVDLPSTLQTQLRKGRDAVLILPAVAVLRRTVELPLAAVSELYSATSFLIERLTPFRSAQVFHAARLLVRDKARKRVRAEIDRKSVV